MRTGTNIFAIFSFEYYRVVVPVFSLRTVSFVQMLLPLKAGILYIADADIGQILTLDLKSR